MGRRCRWAVAALATAAGMAGAAELPENYEVVRLTDYRIFYDNDLEVDFGPVMQIRGLVHTNGNFYATASATTNYHNAVTVAGRFCGGLHDPRDGARFGWYSASNNIFFPSSRDPFAAAIDDAATLAKLHQSPAVAVNDGYMASVIYNPANPAGLPLYSQLEAVGARWAHNPDWVPQSLSYFNGYLKDVKHGVKPVQLAFGTADSPTLLDDPRNFIEAPTGELSVSDPVALQQAAYRSALVIALEDAAFLTNDSAGSAIFSFAAYRYEPGPGGTFDRSGNFDVAYWPDGVAQISANRTSFLSHARIYNGRERKYVNLVDIDLAALAEYLDPSSTGCFDAKFDLSSAHGTDFDGLIYFSLPQALAPSGEQIALRLSNGAGLYDVAANATLDPWQGLSFVTNAPVYTRGDFNSLPTLPVMVAGDAITILSNAFDDADYATGTGNGPNATASDTTVNGVFVTGNVPTVHRIYSGGNEHYFRWIESWALSNPMMFRGCQLNLFASDVASGTWDKNVTNSVDVGYQSPPLRDWDWDAQYDWVIGSPIQPPGMPLGIRAVPALVGGAGPAGLANASGASPLRLWLVADDYAAAKGSAAAWPDRSGNNLTVEPAGNPALSSAAIGGHDAVEFNGTDQWFQIAEGVEDLTEGFGLFVVAESTAATGTRPLVEFGNGPSSDTLAVNIDAAAGQLSVESWIGDDAPPATTPGTVGAGFELHSIVHLQTEGAGVAGTLELRRNGTSTGGGTMPTPVNVARSLCLVGSGSAGSPFQGRIAELVLFSKGPNAAQARIMENSLAAKYGLSIAGDIYAGDGSWGDDVAGVGAEADGQHARAQSTGLRLVMNPSADPGTYVLFGHDGSAALAKGSAELPPPVVSRWQKTWFVDAEGNPAPVVDIEFDFAAEGLATEPTPGGDYRLVGRTGTSGPFQLLVPASGVVEGSVVRFAGIASADLDGMAITLGAVSGSLPVELGAWSVE